MKRLFVLVAILGAVAACRPFEDSASPPARRGPVIMYGDSLLEQATPYVRTTDQVRAFGGTALCDWVDKIAQAAALEQPSVMVVEFSGNNLTPCMSGYDTTAEIRAKYEADAAELKRRVDGVPILWVGPPAFRDREAPTLGAFDPEPLFVDAGAAVLRDGKYTEALPCLPDEGPEQGCVNGRIRVRAPDGVHFGTPASGYESGGRRFAEAIDEAVTGLG
jgi:hypothetical protein